MAIVIVNPRTGKPGGFVSEIVGYNNLYSNKVEKRKRASVNDVTAEGEGEPCTSATDNPE